MGVGTSLGAYFDDTFHQSAAQWDDKYDENEYSGEGITHDDTPVEVKDAMPFPNNSNPDTTFDSRFGNLPKSGILNDIKPQVDKPLLRKISDTETGKYIGELGPDDDISYDDSFPIGRRNGDKIDRHTDPEDYMKKLPAGQEGFTLPDNPTLWIRKKKDEPLTS